MENPKNNIACFEINLIFNGEPVDLLVYHFFYFSSYQATSKRHYVTKKRKEIWLLLLSYQVSQ